MGTQKARIRVLLVAPSLQILGGQAVQATRLLSAISKDPSVTIDFQPLDPQLPAALGFVKHMKFVRTVVTWLEYVGILLLRARHYDILHVFTAAYTSYMLWTIPALAVAKFYGKSIVVNYRDGQAEDHLRNWRTALPTIRRMDAIISPSGFLVDVFAKFGVRIQSISNILDVGTFTYRRRRELRPVFLHNRILEPLYNVPCTLRAFQIVQQHYPAASLTVAHSGPLRTSLEALAAELGLRNTRFIGRVPHAEVAALYDAADVYLTSPDIDCMPGSILECFASGLPVVATRAGGIPYIATDQETALLVPIGDHAAMAEAALRYLRDPDLVERITLNARNSCDRYTEAPVRDAWVALYRRLVSRPEFDAQRSHAQSA
ncbi:MAG TPA: glycosyltransferase family 4 protein [Vicinamibacterales bacterium]|nr:glycosyltransferase family 4 protein [Vicinamibacterales bacterium]